MLLECFTNFPPIAIKLIEDNHNVITFDLIFHSSRKWLSITPDTIPSRFLRDFRFYFVDDCCRRTKDEVECGSCRPRTLAMWQSMWFNGRLSTSVACQYRFSPRKKSVFSYQLLPSFWRSWYFPLRRIKWKDETSGEPHMCNLLFVMRGNGSGLSSVVLVSLFRN